MAGSYNLELSLFGTYSSDMPGFEIWEDGAMLGSSYSISSSGTSISVTVSYSGTMPSALEFRFNDLSGEGGRSVEIRSIRIDDQHVNVGNYLSSNTLTQGGSATVDVAAAPFLFDDSEPLLTEFTTGATRTFTAGANSLRQYMGEDDEVFDMLGGRDVAYLGSGDDKIHGNSGNDILYGGGGNDLISGGSGTDRLFGQDGDDTIYGGTGNDIINGGADNDHLYGGDNNDRLIGGDGDDVLGGGSGNDKLNGGNGDDYLFGGDGDDQLVAGNGVNTVDAGEGADVVYGGNDVDYIDGGDGDDYLIGRGGDDIINAGADNDTVNGNEGNDVIRAGSGDDYVFGEAGTDTIDGDAGADLIVGGAGADIIDGGADNDILHGHGISQGDASILLRANPDVVFNAETNSFYQYVASTTSVGASITSANATTLNGVSGHLVNITSAVENSYVNDLIGADLIWIGASDAHIEGDWLWMNGAESGSLFWSGTGSGSGGAAIGTSYENWNGAGEPNDYGAGEDYAEYRANDVWNDQEVGSRAHLIEWDAGLMNDDNAVDTISGGSGDDTIYGYGGADILNGDAGDDLIYGGNGADTVDGGSNDDVIFGQEGSDTLTGGAGNDIIYAYNALSNFNGTSLSTVTSVLINENFNVDEGVFTYSDGGFGGSDSANVDVVENYITTDGDTANGALEIEVDGFNNSRFTLGSGSWDASFTAGDDLTGVSITFSYRHIHDANNDNGEDSEVWFEFEGTTYDDAGGSSYLSRALGSGGSTDTGWVTVTIDLPDLTSGATYDLSMGILHSDSNRGTEDATVRFDDVLLTGGVSSGTASVAVGDADAGSTNILNGGTGDDTLYGSSGTDTLNGGDDDDTLYSGTVGNDTVLLSEDFTVDEGSFVYADDIFGSGPGSSTYADGLHLSSDGDAANGAIGLELGGINNTNIDDMSGAWQQDVVLLEDASNVSLTFSYRVLDGSGASGNLNSGEDVQLFADIDGTTYSNDANSYFFEIQDPNNNYDSGWQTITLDIGALAAGTHTLSLGGLLTRKTRSYEEMDVRFDDISLVDATSDNTNTLNGGDGLDTLYGSSGSDIFMFEATSAYDDLDAIENFNAGLDSIDFSDLLSGYDSLTDDITDFVEITEASGNTTIAVDADGAGGFSDVAIINGVTGLDVALMEIDGSLIV